MSKTRIGRLSFRVEGDWWVVYWHPEQHTTHGAVQLSSIKMNLVQDEKVKNAFVAVMQLAFDVLTEEVFGATPSWSEPVSAPESERSGRT